MRIGIAILLGTAACSGRVVSAPQDSCDATYCATFGDKARGETVCAGQLRYICCGYTVAQLEHLVSTGDAVAPHCLGDD